MKKVIILPMLTLLALWGYIGYREYQIAEKYTHSQNTSVDDILIQPVAEKLKNAEKIRKEQRELEAMIDMETDTSLQKFVNNKVSFNDLSYIPQDLVSIDSEYVIDSKGNGQIRKVISDEFQTLAEKFYNDLGAKLNIVSSYRSYLYQKGIKDRGCPDNLCAKAGYSEHQSGLAIDIFSASTYARWKNDETLWSYFQWMNQNAHNFGFHNTYQKGLEIDGYEIEPWHWRYVGKDLAKKLHEDNITLAEYYYGKKK